MSDKACGTCRWARRMGSDYNNPAPRGSCYRLPPTWHKESPSVRPTVYSTDSACGEWKMSDEERQRILDRQNKTRTEDAQWEAARRPWWIKWMDKIGSK